VQAQVTDPSDGLPAAAGIPDWLVLLTPPQAGFVMQAPNGLIDLAQPPRAPGRRSRGRGSIGGPTRRSERHRGQGRAGQARKEEVGTRAGVVSRVRISSRFAQAIGTDRNTYLN